jgi:hypothetical protein
MDRLDDLAVYRRLLSVCDELSELADACWSPRSSAVVRWLASVVQRAAEHLRAAQS